MDSELTAAKSLAADVDAMIRTDYREARVDPKRDIDALCARLLTAIENGQPQSRAIVEHRKAWRAALGLRPLC